MTRGTPPAAAGRIEVIVSGVLRAGVYASVGLIAIGLVVWFARHPSLLTSAAELKLLLAAETPVPRSLTQVFSGVLRGDGECLVALGLLVLIATPVVRVAITGLSFVGQRDRTFTWISAGVLLVLGVSVWLGAGGH